MNYQWHYEQLIQTRSKRERDIGKYYERHHVLPISLGGNNEDENLVYLTAREHFIAHWFLWRIYKNKSMALAFHCMTRISPTQQRIFSSKGYAEARESVSKFLSEDAKRRFTGVPKTDEQKRKMSVAASGKQKSKQHRENISKAFTGYKWSVERNRKMAKSVSEGGNGRAKPIIQLDNNEIIYRYWGICEIIRKYRDQVNPRKLRNAVRNELEYPLDGVNFKWKYESK